MEETSYMLHMEYSFVWSETQILQKADQIYFESSGQGQTDGMKSEELLLAVAEDRDIKRRSLTVSFTCFVGTAY